MCSVGISCLLLCTFVVFFNCDFAQEQVYETLIECRVSDPLSCDQTKNEVCTFSNGKYSCECPNGVSRIQDGRCIIINECLQPRLNDCHQNAKCVDLDEGYTCQCSPGFADLSEDKGRKPGRICQSEVNECLSPEVYKVDCSGNAACQDTADSFTCVCRPGFTDISAHYSLMPGRKCVEIVNECVNGDNDCSGNADCIDQPDGYICKCRQGYVDASPNVTHYPGRQCISPKIPEYATPQSIPCNPGTEPPCPSSGTCPNDNTGQSRCQCVKSPDGSCMTFNKCEKHHDCDPSALCSNTFDSYKCQCKPGFLDTSPDPVRFPGRKCQELVNECGDHTNDCSPFASCQDTQDSYLCKCNEGLTDVSSRYGLKPGRKCSQKENECSNRTRNSCDENADCVQLPDGYTCKCISGYIDVSSNANLAPGRVCTLQTTCPSQPTDLVFLIDGSGSIGSDVFHNEVLRFLNEFVELFDVSPNRTRVAVVQYSDRIKHEFDLNEYKNLESLRNAIIGITYLTGLTRTGAAIDHVSKEAFSEQRGARPVSNSVTRVAIVITDGRSQDNVSIAADNARARNIQLFAVGVTNHILDSELEAITGSKQRLFHVNAFEDLNAKLRSAIQKVACPEDKPVTPPKGPCNPATHQGCDRSLNQICMMKDGEFICSCPPGFEKHPITQICGGDTCNPQLVSSCPHPEICRLTPFGNYRCICALNTTRSPNTGTCKGCDTSIPCLEPSVDECSPQNPCGKNEECVKSASGGRICQCLSGFERNPRTDKCQLIGTCDPSMPNSCDARKNEKCLSDGGEQFTCKCPLNYHRHPITEICLIDECAAQLHDCDPNAACIDTDESYICTCHIGFLDISPNLNEKPGRVCKQQIDECMEGKHNCSVNAVCINLPDGFLCRCKDNFVDFSPNPLHFAGTDCKPLIDECSNPSLNTCSENAICVDTKENYKCHCKEGFIDQDELRNPGRICQKINRICSEGKHDCGANARCIEKGTNDYTCLCNAGFMDRSPDRTKPGRICIEQICLDPKKHDCHEAAICMEAAGPEGYTCKCRDGYIDQNISNPGRKCKEEINECLDASLNDCDPSAICHDLKEGYTCTCPIGSKDISPDENKAGRKCFALVNECRNPHLNNCSRFADCIDKEDGYDCKCRPEYHDNNPANPGTDCSFIIDECESPNLNDCDQHAKCIDTLDGFTCDCIAPYKDEFKSNPGRVCRFNECEDPEMNDCDKNADCRDTDEGFTCQCKAGFYDDGNNPRKPGRNCVALPTGKPPLENPPTLGPNLLPCGSTFCHLDLDEVCIGGSHCGCRPNQNRPSEKSKCVDVQKIPIEIRIISDGNDKLVYGSNYGNPNSSRYVEIVDEFINSMHKAVQDTSFAPKYITSEVTYVTNPKVRNSSWDDGLLFNGTVDFSSTVDKCEFWKGLIDSIERSNYHLGNGNLVLAKDINLLDPCRKEEQKGLPCGLTFCRSELGEQCIAGRVCGCPNGQKRSGLDEQCRTVESWSLPLWVIREGSALLNYSDNLANPHNDNYKRLVEAFEKGIAYCYSQMALKNAFVTSEVNDILNPSSINKTWDHGILYNFTANFVRGSVQEPSRIYTDLIEYIMKNNFEVGKSNQFISPIQANPFENCYKSDCHPNAICKNEKNGYSCVCPGTYRDLNPTNPGHVCLNTIGVNECENSEWNECDVNARCIDEQHLYRCECIKPYVNAAEKDRLPGSLCQLDYCSDVNFCPANTTCVNTDEQAVCSCLPGYINVRTKGHRLEPSRKTDIYCLKIEDIDECTLGLHNCSAAAICTDLRNGYECACPEGYTDGNPLEPGRVCAALLCGLCNGHGDCVHNSLTNNVTCSCVEGYTGEFCEVAPSKIPLLLALLLALLFLLLTLCCCLYFCLKTRCFGSRGMSASSLSGREEMLGSDYYTIPRAKLRKRSVDESRAVVHPMEANAGALQRYLDDGASVSSGSSVEEVERRVITDVTRSEIRTTTITDADGSKTVYGVTSTSSGENAGGQISSAQFVVHPPVETEAEQFATTMSDHYLQSTKGGGEGYSGGEYRQRERYESGSDESDAGEASFNRVTKATNQHNYVPGGDGRSGTERMRNEFYTTTTATETNYF